MASRTPVVRQISWLATFPQLIAILLAIVIATQFLGREGVVVGAAVYLVYSIGSRRVVPRYHRQGMARIRRQQYAKAIPLFQRSLEFFDRHPWIDDYRSLVLMSPSAASYREMALANIAFCHSQIGDGIQSRRYYEECLSRFPDSGIATSAVKMMESVDTADS